MKDDPRHKNVTFDDSSIATYLADYAHALSAAIQAVDTDALDRARTLIEEASHKGNRIFAVGNGGSAAIADHLCCDWTKGTHCEGHPTIQSFSLTSNVALYSAIANDYGFEKVFSTQVQFFGKPGDVLVAISSSGNSENIVAAVEHAHTLGMSTIGLSGFKGGRLKDTAQVSLYIPAQNYGVVEDAHQSLMHILAQFIANGRDKG
jgi:D-sedoheptulose 7-phosphate isomerase